MKKAERKRASLLANLSDLNRPLRVRPVRVMGREWWAIDPEDTWPGMVMDLRRLGFESIAWEDEVLVCEGSQVYDSHMDSPAAPGGLKPFPTIHPTIQIRKETYSTDFSNLDYFSGYDDEEDPQAEDDMEPEDLQYE